MDHEVYNNRASFFYFCSLNQFEIEFFLKQKARNFVLSYWLLSFHQSDPHSYLIGYSNINTEKKKIATTTTAMLFFDSKINHDFPSQPRAY
jgi:hypothetical protein